MKLGARAGAVLAVSLMLAMPAGAAAQDPASLEGFAFSVQDNMGLGPDLISGALEQAVPPPAGTPLCGGIFLPSFPVTTGDITVIDGVTTDDRAFGSGNVINFQGGGVDPAVGAAFAFDAMSGPLGEDPSGTFDVEFPTGRPSSGVVTCLQIVGNIAFIGGRRTKGLPQRPGKGCGDENHDHTGPPGNPLNTDCPLRSGPKK